MGAKCSCLSTPSEVRQASNLDKGKSPKAENDRFSLQDQPLRVSEIFRPSSSIKYDHEHIEYIKNDNADDDDPNNESLCVVTPRDAMNLLDSDSNQSRDDTLQNPSKLSLSSKHVRSKTSQSTSLVSSVIYGTEETMDHLITGYLRRHMLQTHPPIVNELCCKYYHPYAFTPNISDDSMILTTSKERKLLFDLLVNHWRSQCDHKLYRFDLPLIHLELVFRASRDGIEDFKTFHKTCDDQKHILVVIKSRNGQIFGAFTAIKPSVGNGSSSGYYDQDAFLWSLTNHKVFEMNNAHNNHSLDGDDDEDNDRMNVCLHGGSQDIGIRFGSGPDLIIKKQCCSDVVNEVKPLSFKFETHELIGKENENENDGRFIAQDIELYSVYGR